MSKEKDGGPAFPLTYEHTEVVTRMKQLGEISTEQLLKYTKQLRGISVRDYFAAKAMQNYMGDDCTPDAIAKAAYEMADAMLKARGTQ